MFYILVKYFKIYYLVCSYEIASFTVTMGVGPLLKELFAELGTDFGPILHHPLFLRGHIVLLQAAHLSNLVKFGASTS
jgi:hypothetical protein